MIVEIFIPCFNEEDNIDALVSSWAKAVKLANGYLLLITFIDNGSEDLTKKRLLQNLQSKNENLSLVIKQNNTGYGAGIMHGVNNSEAGYIGWAHADLQFNPMDLVKKLNKVLENSENIKEVFIVGKRVNRRLFDKFFTTLMSFVVFLFRGIYFNDINAQPKIFYNKLVKDLSSFPDDFNLDLFTILKAKEKNYLFKSIQIDFEDRKFGEAKGGGSLFGKIKLSIQVFKYLIFKK